MMRRPAAVGYETVTSRADGSACPFSSRRGAPVSESSVARLA